MAWMLFPHRDDLSLFISIECTVYVCSWCSTKHLLHCKSCYCNISNNVAIEKGSYQLLKAGVQSSKHKHKQTPYLPAWGAKQHQQHYATAFPAVFTRKIYRSKIHKNLQYSYVAMVSWSNYDPGKWHSSDDFSIKWFNKIIFPWWWRLHNLRKYKPCYKWVF